MIGPSDGRRWPDALSWHVFEDGELVASWESTQEHRAERMYNPRTDP